MKSKVSSLIISLLSLSTVHLTVMTAKASPAHLESFFCPSGEDAEIIRFDKSVPPYVDEIQHCGDVGIEYVPNSGRWVLSFSSHKRSISFAIDNYEFRVDRETAHPIQGEFRLSINSYFGSDRLNYFDRTRNLSRFSIDLTSSEGFSITHVGCPLNFPAFRFGKNIVLTTPTPEMRSVSNCMIEVHK